MVFSKICSRSFELAIHKGIGRLVYSGCAAKGNVIHSRGGEAPLLDIVAYSGYAFARISLGVLARLYWNYSYYFVTSWMSICMGMFLVKTMKRVIFTDIRSYEKHPTRQHYLLLFVGILQFPLFYLGNLGASLIM